MKNLLIIAITLLAITACTKEYEDRNIQYQVTGLAKPYKLVYLTETGETVMKTITPANDGEVWQYQFQGKQGDLVYMFAEFTDIDLVPAKFKFRILIDGKSYKESYGYDHSIGDTLFRVKRSGVVPF
jgi:hypothetical protein